MSLVYDISTGHDLRRQDKSNDSIFVASVVSDNNIDTKNDRLNANIAQFN